MTAAIEILSGDLIGRSYAVDEMPFTIGRKDDNAIVIPKKYFSRRHAEIVREGSGFAIRGLSGKNPIKVNDAEVEEHPLSDGDEFEICGVRFRFRSDGRGQTKQERAVERASGVHASLGASGKSGTARRSRGGRDAEADDDMLGEDEATENRQSGARMDDLDDGELPPSDDGDEAGVPKGATVSELEDGPLPGEEDGGSGSAGGSFKFDSEPKNVRSTSKGSGGADAGLAAAKSAKGSTGGAKESLKADGAPGWKPEPEKGPRERVVFAMDDAGAAPKKSKSSGSGEDKEERTDQIDVSKLKKDDDPFAPDPKRLDKDPAALAAREKFLKSLVGLGLFGICFAVGILYWMQKPKGPPPVFNIALEPPCAVNETRQYSQPLNEDDPPDVDRRTPLNGDPSGAIDGVSDATIARIEWAVPDVPRVAYFLVTGISEGSTSFQLKSKAGVTTIYTVAVRGTSSHDLAKKKRQESLASLGEDELKRRIEKNLSSGEQLEKQLQVTGLPDKYARAILHEYELADEELNALAKLIDQSGVSDPTMGERRDKVKAALDASTKFWEEERDHARTNYVDLVRKNDWAPAAVALKQLLGILGDHCGADFQRYFLILDKKYGPPGYYNGNYKDPGCIEVEPR